ncbi:MAG: ABC transporter ATP-binding protein [Pseudomonadota bacterium]
MVSVKLDNVGLKYILDNTRQRSIKHKLFDCFQAPQKKVFWALKNINLDLKAGDTLGIKGKNGSGKTTLLRLIGKIYRPDEGKISVQGKPLLLSIGSGFEKNLSGFENILLNGAIHGLSQNKIKALLPNIIEFADLGDFIYQPLRTYSSGMYSRLGFSIAINIDPDILLIDEVFSVGDQEFKLKCKEKIKNIIKAKNKIVAIVSHDPELLKKLCNKTICLNKGSN